MMPRSATVGLHSADYVGQKIGLPATPRRSWVPTYRTHSGSPVVLPVGIALLQLIDTVLPPYNGTDDCLGRRNPGGDESGE